MADFDQSLNYILNSVYGKDVRRAIYDALVYLSNNMGTGSGGSGSSGLHTLPVASSSTLGGIKTSSDFSISSDGKLSIANNKVVRKDGYADSEILNFLHIDINKKIVPVPILGNWFKLETDENDNIVGLDFSTNGRLRLLDFITNAIELIGLNKTTNSDGIELDDLYDAYSVYFPLSTTENTSLYSAFGGIAEGAFVSAYSIETENGIRYVQAAIPVKSASTSALLGIVTRSKHEGRIWTDWMSVGNADSGSISNVLTTKILDRSEVDVRGEQYSTYLPLSPNDDDNADLYNAFNGQAAGVFIWSGMIKDDNGIVYAVQRAIPARAENATGPMPCIATRSKYHGKKWFAWNAAGSDGGSTGGNSDDWWFGTRAEYDALSESEKTEKSLYFIEEGS